jgi:hypothetical protein
VHSVQQLEPGAALTAALADGTADLCVTAVRAHAQR